MTSLAPSARKRLPAVSSSFFSLLSRGSQARHRATASASVRRLKEKREERRRCSWLDERGDRCRLGENAVENRDGGDSNRVRTERERSTRQRGDLDVASPSDLGPPDVLPSSRFAFWYPSSSCHSLKGSAIPSCTPLPFFSRTSKRLSPFPSPLAPSSSSSSASSSASSACSSSSASSSSSSSASSSSSLCPSAALAAVVRAATAAVKRSHHDSSLWRSLGDEASLLLLRLQDEMHCSGGGWRLSGDSCDSDDEAQGTGRDVEAGGSLAASGAVAAPVVARDARADLSSFGRDLSMLVNRFKQMRFFHARFLQTAEQAALASLELLSLHDAALLAASFAALECNSPSFFFSLADHICRVSTSPSPPVARAAQAALRVLRQSSSPSSPASPSSSLLAPASALSVARRRDLFLSSLPPSASYPLSLLLATAREPGGKCHSRLHFPRNSRGAAALSGLCLAVADEIEVNLALSWVHLLSGFARAHIAHADLFEVAALPLSSFLETKAASLLILQRRALERRSVARARLACPAGARMQVSLSVGLRGARRRGQATAEETAEETDAEGVAALHGDLIRPAGSRGGGAAHATMPGRTVAKVVEAYAAFRYKHERLLRAATSTVSFLSFTDSDIESLRRSLETLDFQSPELERVAALRTSAPR
ncbi:hypothetical protein TGDOM2_288880 [Toxoplasma gondii GAB2-2007-GAL-DOM2]|uniref:Uncharacterized protein n=4 Tax=Toxoplasma gondii TaxID=5811 RepID=A0A086L9C3_TOXGO|nr:hypothetical protein TGRH88_013670 [Toxoplasma gondii]KFG42756.1 hypothetical protein TGDOM2_288880 [Toxoplasma gondii GAB2-2007-GAL-DOM2]KFG53241.1 hypothetical protein TGFOU_288880 [Toxoplasma gondii FOU]RQX73824.1 hypothetical protein TGCAST_288880 [Toxoplasma gondii CAST]